MAILVDDRTRPHGGLVRTITIARPDRRNALDPDHLKQLFDAVLAAEQHGLVRAIVITGQGSAFCAGYDLGVPLEGTPLGPPDARVVDTMTAVRNCALPIVARVNGPTFGAGLELAISCDLRVASDKATFCLPPAKLGIAYAAGGLARLGALVGTAGARRLALTAMVVDAAQALDMGLVEELVAAEELDARTEVLSNMLADGAPLAIQAMKRTLNALEARLAPEALALAERDRMVCYASEDAAEGVRAFAEKRAPAFRGR